MAGMIFEPAYDPQAILRNRESLPEEKAMAETAQHLRGVIAAIRPQMDTLITANVVEFLKTRRATESREQQAERLEMFEERFRSRWETSGCNYADVFQRHNVQAANREDFAEAWEQEFRLKRDETIHAVLQQKLGHSPLTQTMENRKLEEYEKIRALDRIKEGGEVARLASLLAESKQLFAESWTQPNPWKVDVDRWISYAYQMAPPAEQRQYDLITHDIPPGRLHMYVHGKILLNIAAAVTSGALFMASSSATSFVGCAVLAANMGAQIWLRNRYSNRVDAALIAPLKELRADHTLSGALMWTGVLYKSIRDLNPVWTFRDRTKYTNDVQAASVTRLLSSFTQIGETLHREIEDSVDDAVDRLKRGSRRGLTQAYYQSQAITVGVNPIELELDNLHRRMSAKGIVSTVIATYAGFGSIIGMASILFGK